MFKNGIEKVMKACEKFGMGVIAKGVGCGVDECVKSCALRWFGHLIEMKENEFDKRVYKGGAVKERPTVSWISRVSEYWSRIECDERVPEQGEMETLQPQPPPGGQFS